MSLENSGLNQAYHNATSNVEITTEDEKFLVHTNQIIPEFGTDLKLEDSCLKMHPLQDTFHATFILPLLHEYESLS